MTPLGAVIRGAIAGAVGIAAMDLVWYRRYRKGGGEHRLLDWEFSAGMDSWEKAPAPAQVGKRVAEGYLQTELPPMYARLTNNVVHWAYGIGWGVAFGILAGSARAPRARWGLLLGPFVWAFGYVALPPAKLYKPMWEYDRDTLAKDLSAHVAYGIGTAAAFKVLSGR